MATNQGAHTSFKVHKSQDEAVQYAAKHSLRLHPAQQKLIDATLKHPRSGMMGSADQLNLLQNLAQAIGAKKTLDIGVFTGYSALTMALALPADGKVVACDITDEHLELGRPFWKEADVDGKIEFIKGPAVETLEKLVEKGESGTFDMAFIDADKTNYDNYYELSLKLLRKGGIIAMDNVLWSGTVYDLEKQNPDVVALRAIADKVHADDRVNVSLLVLGDGTLLAFKK